MEIDRVRKHPLYSSALEKEPMKQMSLDLSFIESELAINKEDYEKYSRYNATSEIEKMNKFRLLDLLKMAINEGTELAKDMQTIIDIDARTYITSVTQDIVKSVQKQLPELKLYWNNPI